MNFLSKCSNGRRIRSRYGISEPESIGRKERPTQSGRGDLSADESAVARHYDKLAASYSQLYEGQSRMAHFYNVRRRRVIELLKDVAGKRVLEVGCATGQMVESLIARNNEYCGIDISSGMIAQCQKKFSHLANVHFAVGDTRNLGFPDCSFECALCLGMLEYVPDERTTISELARVLKPDGTLILSGLNTWSPYNAWDRLVYRRLTRRRPAAIVNEYHDENEYRAWLALEQLSIVDIVYFDFHLFLAPLDRRFARWAVSTSEQLELNGRGWARRLGNGFLVKAVKGADRR
jgi:ubiquinone/menaquinone biosynthesis C-methylase UbiE